MEVIDYHRGFEIFIDTLNGIHVYVVMIVGNRNHGLDCQTIDEAKELIDDIISTTYQKAAYPFGDSYVRHKH